MATRFVELYADFQDQIDIYVPKLKVSELLFMRLLSRGAQIFQRETKLIEAKLELLRNANGVFQLPEDILEIKEIRDKDSNPEQWLRAVDEIKAGRPSVAQHYSYGIGDYYFHSFPVERLVPLGTEVPIASVYSRILHIYPDDSAKYPSLWLWYIIDLQPISESSPQWAAWQPFDVNFETMFRGATINPVLSPYQDALVAFAIAEYLKSKGSVNYQVFEQKFWLEIERAKLNKPEYYQELYGEYNMLWK